VTIDLRGLASALKQHANARHLTVSDAARLAVAEALGTASCSPEVSPSGEPDADRGQWTKLTIRLRRSVAERLTTPARACGLSHGAYLTTMIDGTPAPPLAAVTALNASTDQLAVVSADLNEVIRLLRDRQLPADKEVDEFTRKILEALRKHLDLASRVVADLRPARAYPTRRSTRGAGEPVRQ
jgi:hypothetical protein